MLRLCAVLLAYNKSSGYRWSAIPKPPPRGVDRLYGTHSVLCALRVFAKGMDSSAVADPSPAQVAARDPPASPRSPHPHRRSLYCLYVRDFSLDDATANASGVKRKDHNDNHVQSDQAKGGVAGSDQPGSDGALRQKKVIPARYSTLHRIVALAKQLRVPVRFVPRAELVQLCGERRNQHVVLEVSSFTPTPITSLTDLFTTGATREDGEAAVATTESHASGASAAVCEGQYGRRVVVYLDHIVDPTNVGNILRTAYFNGVDDVIMSVDSASCTPAVARTSTGFLEYTRVFQATSPTATFLRQSLDDWVRLCPARATCEAAKTAQTPHSDGRVRFDIIATTTTEKARSAHRTRPTHASVKTTVLEAASPRAETAPTSRMDSHVQLLVLGNEDRGLSEDVVRQCTHTMHVHSIRQERLRTSAAVARQLKEATHTDTDGGVKAGTSAVDGEAGESVFTSSDASSAQPYTVRRLWQLRPQEVTLNVNAACSAMLCLLTSEGYAAHIHPITHTEPMESSGDVTAPTPTEVANTSSETDEAE